MRYKLCKFCENRPRDTPLWGVYIPHFDEISVKISLLGCYTLIVAPIGVKFERRREPKDAGRKTSKSASE